MNILFGVTGSVAAIKIREVATELRKLGAVKIVATPCALSILQQIENATLGTDESVKDGRNLSWYNETLHILTDQQEWAWKHIGDPVLHIELKEWADILVIAPLSANTLAKLANGICDNLLTCIYRAFPLTKPIVVAPAMNTDMWEHPLTDQHLSVLYKRHNAKIFNFVSLEPVEKKLACGTVGIGAMASPEDIAKRVKEM